MMRGLKQEYGAKKGERVYFQMEQKKKKKQKEMKLAGLKSKK